MAENENTTTTKPEKPTFWTPDHRIIFANSFSLRMGNNDVSLELSTEQNVNGTDGYLSSTQLMMTPASAKVLAILLTKSLERLEKEMGLPIPVDIERVKAMEKQIASTPAIKST